MMGDDAVTPEPTAETVAPQQAPPIWAATSAAFNPTEPATNAYSQTCVAAAYEAHCAAVAALRKQHDDRLKALCVEHLAAVDQLVAEWFEAHAATGAEHQPETENNTHGARP